MLEVADGETITITEKGTYILTGTASECTVLVNAADAKSPACTGRRHNHQYI